MCQTSVRKKKLKKKPLFEKDAKWKIRQTRKIQTKRYII